MGGDEVSLSRRIFEELPDGVGEEDFTFGILVVGMGAMEGVEVARAFAEAGDRLLDVALNRRESWEAAYPILFCYRHALELYLKAAIPSEVKRSHGLDGLWSMLQPYLDGHYRADHVAWLQDRILEFHSLDPKATAFRYHDSRAQGDPELWLDFSNLKTMVRLMFQALEHVRLGLYDRVEPAV